MLKHNAKQNYLLYKIMCLILRSSTLFRNHKDNHYDSDITEVAIY